MGFRGVLGEQPRDLVHHIGHQVHGTFRGIVFPCQLYQLHIAVLDNQEGDGLDGHAAGGGARRRPPACW